MCRWITLISSKNLSLSDVVLAPSNSLVQLSRDASFHPGYDSLNNAIMNGDGFGVGWYHSNVVICPLRAAPSTDGGNDHVSTTTAPTRTSPTTVIVPDTGAPVVRAAAFKDVFPAWNNMNLRELCMSTTSNCIMAHVRAASKGTGVSHNNCHPFKAGRLLFCHNGRIDRFQLTRRKFLAHVSDEAFANIHGTTDSEVIFGLILTHLGKDAGCGSAVAQTTAFGHSRLVSAIKKSIKDIDTILREAGMVGGYSTLNFSITDGDTMVVTRYCADKSETVPPPSLYFAYGETDTLYEELTNEESVVVMNKSESVADAMGEVHANGNGDGGDVSSSDDEELMEEAVTLDHHESKPGTILANVNPTTATFIVTSNPLTRTHTWHKMPRNSIVWCTRGHHPELRLLMDKKQSKKVLIMKQNKKIGGLVQ
jgi:glutamine amidotransferase